MTARSPALFTGLLFASALSLSVNANPPTTSEYLVPVSADSNVSVEVNGKGGRIKVYSTEGGENAGYVEIRQMGIYEIDEYGHPLSDNWNIGVRSDWPDSYNGPNPCPPSTGELDSDGQGIIVVPTCLSFSATQYPRTGKNQFQLDANVFAEATTSFTSQLSCGPDICTTCDLDAGGIAGVGECGGCVNADGNTCSARKLKRGVDPFGDLDESSYNARCANADLGAVLCRELVSTSEVNTYLEYQLSNWNFYHPDSRLRYTIQVKARFGEEESGKWFQPLLDGDNIVINDLAELRHLQDDDGNSCDFNSSYPAAAGCLEEAPVAVSYYSKGKASYIQIDFPRFSEDSYLRFIGNFISFKDFADLYPE